MMEGRSNNNTVTSSPPPPASASKARWKKAVTAVTITRAFANAAQLPPIAASAEESRSEKLQNLRVNMRRTMSRRPDIDDEDEAPTGGAPPAAAANTVVTSHHHHGENDNHLNPIATKQLPPRRSSNGKEAMTTESRKRMLCQKDDDQQQQQLSQSPTANMNVIDFERDEAVIPIRRGASSASASGCGAVDTSTSLNCDESLIIESLDNDGSYEGGEGNRGGGGGGGEEEEDPSSSPSIRQSSSTSAIDINVPPTIVVVAGDDQFVGNGGINPATAAAATAGRRVLRASTTTTQHQQNPSSSSSLLGGASTSSSPTARRSTMAEMNHRRSFRRQEINTTANNPSPSSSRHDGNDGSGDDDSPVAKKAAASNGIGGMAEDGSVLLSTAPGAAGGGFEMLSPPTPPPAGGDNSTALTSTAPAAVNSIFSCVSCRRAITIEPHFSVAYFIPPTMTFVGSNNNTHDDHQTCDDGGDVTTRTPTSAAAPAGLNDDHTSFPIAGERVKEKGANYSFTSAGNNSFHHGNRSNNGNAVAATAAALFSPATATAPTSSSLSNSHHHHHRQQSPSSSSPPAMTLAMMGPTNTLCVRYAEDLSLGNGRGGGGGGNGGGAESASDRFGGGGGISGGGGLGLNRNSTNPALRWQDTLRQLDCGLIGSGGSPSSPSSPSGAVGSGGTITPQFFDFSGSGGKPLAPKKVPIPMTFWRKRQTIQVFPHSHHHDTTQQQQTNSNGIHCGGATALDNNSSFTANANTRSGSVIGGSNNNHPQHQNEGGRGFGAQLRNAPFTIPPATLAELKSTYHRRAEALVSIGTPMITNHKSNFGLVAQSILCDTAVGVDVSQCAPVYARFGNYYQQQQQQQQGGGGGDSGGSVRPPAVNKKKAAHAALINNAASAVLPLVAEVAVVESSGGGVGGGGENGGLTTTSTSQLEMPRLTAANWAGQQTSHLPATVVTLTPSATHPATATAPPPSLTVAKTANGGGGGGMGSFFASAASPSSSQYASNSGPPYTSGFNIDRSIIKEALQYTVVVAPPPSSSPPSPPIPSVLPPTERQGEDKNEKKTKKSSDGAMNMAATTEKDDAVATDGDGTGKDDAMKRATSSSNNNNEMLLNTSEAYREAAVSMAVLARGYRCSPDLLRDSDETAAVEEQYQYQNMSSIAHRLRPSPPSGDQKNQQHLTSSSTNGEAEVATAPTAAPSPTATAIIKTPLVALKVLPTHRIQRRRLLALYETISEQAGGVDLPLCAACNTERSVALQSAIRSLREKIRMLTEYLKSFDEMGAVVKQQQEEAETLIGGSVVNNSNTSTPSRSAALGVTPQATAAAATPKWSAACQEAFDISILLLGAGGGSVGAMPADEATLQTQTVMTAKNAAAAEADKAEQQLVAQQQKEEIAVLDVEIDTLHRELQALLVQEKSELDVTETLMSHAATTAINARRFELYTTEGEKWLDNGLHRTEHTLKTQSILMRAFRFDFERPIAMVNELRVGRHSTSFFQQHSSSASNGSGDYNNDPPTNEEINCACGFLLQLVMTLASKRKIHSFTKPYRLIYRGSQSVIENRLNSGKTETYDFFINSRLFSWNTFGSAWVAFASCVADIVSHFERRILDLRKDPNAVITIPSSSSSSSPITAAAPTTTTAASLLKEIPSMPAMPITSDGGVVGGYAIKYGATSDENWTTAVRHLMILLDWCVKVEGRL